MSNISVGNESERKIIEILKNNGYWVYNTPHKTNGQPVDIIAIKKNNSWLIDAKHVEEKMISFSFDRIEPNQITTCLYASGFAGIENIGFAIDFDRDTKVRFLSFKTYQEMVQLGRKSVKMQELPLFEGVLSNEI